jgi:hypothetical protein
MEKETEKKYQIGLIRQQNKAEIDFWSSFTKTKQYGMVSRRSNLA